mmetsp:Transcript_1962/g.3650  ORF Transcript_1962/g.3650 Transcript_1962/m.3650 type:complete len:209 (-) Transcript_1962:265-891(-)
MQRTFHSRTGTPEASCCVQHPVVQGATKRGPWRLRFPHHDGGVVVPHACLKSFKECLVLLILQHLRALTVLFDVALQYVGRSEARDSSWEVGQILVIAPYPVHLGVVVVGLLHWEGPEVILGHEEPHALHHRSAHAANLRLEGDLELVRARLVPKQQARVALVELEEVQMSVGPILGCERVFRAVVGVVRHGGGQVGPGPVQIFHHGC